MPTARLPIWICHSPARCGSAAFLHRGHQLATIGMQFLGRHVDIVLRAVPDGGALGPWAEDVVGGVVWLCPDTSTGVPQATVAALRARNRAVIADWREDVPDGPGLTLFDRHVFASLAAYRDARATHPLLPLGYVATSHDLRLRRRRNAATDRLRPLWPGDPQALSTKPVLASRVARAAPGAVFSDVLGGLHRFNCHVLVGADLPPRMPPVTLFAAAAVGAVVLVDQTTDPDGDFVGRYYPYRSEDGSEEAALDLLDYAKRTFGGPIWSLARERMVSVADRTSPGTVASDLDRVLEETLGGDGWLAA